VAAIGVVIYLTARRLWLKIRQFRELRLEIRELDEQVRRLRAGGQRKD
jgi:hypothetical protein